MNYKHYSSKYAGEKCHLTRVAMIIEVFGTKTRQLCSPLYSCISYNKSSLDDREISELLNDFDEIASISNHLQTSSQQNNVGRYYSQIYSISFDKLYALYLYYNTVLDVSFTLFVD